MKTGARGVCGLLVGKGSEWGHCFYMCVAPCVQAPWEKSYAGCAKTKRVGGAW